MPRHPYFQFYKLGIRSRSKVGLISKIRDSQKMGCVEWLSRCEGGTNCFRTLKLSSRGSNGTKSSTFLCSIKAFGPVFVVGIFQSTTAFCPLGQEMGVSQCEGSPTVLGLVSPLQGIQMGHTASCFTLKLKHLDKYLSSCRHVSAKQVVPARRRQQTF